MRLTYIMWGYEHDDEILRSFAGLGFEVERITASPEAVKKIESVRDILWEMKGDIVFSVNFFSAISAFCQAEGIPYASWVLALPDFDLYTQEAANPCNYLALCDSYLVEKLWERGIEKAFLLPDAIEMPKEDHAESVPEYRGVCFVAGQPETTLHTAQMSLYGKGYVEAFLHAQRVLMGEYLLENGLIDRVERELAEENQVPAKIVPACERLYLADQYLAPSCTVMQQEIFTQNFDNIMTIYSDGGFAGCKCEKHPYPMEKAERDRIYREREFTLVLAPHVLHNGISRQMLEVIAAGGFPLCAMQKDARYLFQENVNLACFRNPREFNKLLVQYGNSHEERERLRKAAYGQVLTQHTYESRLTYMLDMWGKL